MLIALLLVMAAATPEEIGERLQKALSAANDFSADFKHTHFAAARRGKGRSESGKVFVKKPGLMRWDYTTPAIKYFVIDGERLWFYKPEEGQVLVNDKFKITDISAGLSFLWSTHKLADDFEIRHFSGPDPQGEAVPAEAIKLTPKKADPDVKEIVFYLGSSGFIAKAMAKDHLGNINVLALENVQLNVGLKRDAFLFVPPEGVKVIHVE